MKCSLILWNFNNIFCDWGTKNEFFLLQFLLGLKSAQSVVVDDRFIIYDKEHETHLEL